MMHPDLETHANRIIRHYSQDGTFTDLSVDETIAQKRNAWQGWLCSAGVRHLYIDYDGDVWSANCRIKKLGSIYADIFFEKNWIICNKSFCGCGADIMTPKVKNEENKSLLMNMNDHSPAGKTVMRRGSIGDPVACETSFRPKIQVFWDLHRRCNYDCSYCWPQVHNTHEKFKPYDLLLKISDRLMNEFANNEKIHFMFGGGEPTLDPNFLDWMTYLNEHGHSCVVTSNGSRNHDYYEKLIAVSSLNLSVHFESFREEKFLKNVEAIVQKKLKNEPAGALEIKIMVPPNRLKQAIAFRDKLVQIPGFYSFKNDVNWSFAPIRSIADSERLVEYDSTEFESFLSELRDNI